MAIALCGAFDYVAVVPDGRGSDDFESRAIVRESTNRANVDISESWLVGISPHVRISNVGQSDDKSLRPPWNLRKRSLITLVASTRDQATVAQAAFYTDKAFTDCMTAGDQIHLSRTGCGGLGYSVIRDGRLVAAVGAITAVPLGSGVRISIPRDLISSAAAVFRKRDPDFEFTHMPLEVEVAGARSILSEGVRFMGDYRVIVRHGFLEGEPGTDESVSIFLDRICTHAAGEFSAMLLDDPDALSMSW